MHSIIQLFIRHGGLLTLVVVEALCFYLITSYNDPQGQISSASWARYSGTMLNWKSSIKEYLYLRDDNIRLRIENARLTNRLKNSQIIEVPSIDTVRRMVQVDTLENKIIRPEYYLISARVVNHTMGLPNNWMIINRGELDNVEINTGVITRSGVAGVVRRVSDHFAVAMSVLHSETKISVALKGYDYYGSLVWEGGDPRFMSMMDIPKHIPVKPGDTVLVSNYSLLFPEGHMVGTVEKATTQQGSNFSKIQVRLSQNPANIGSVYVVGNRYADELNQLQKKRQDE